MRHFLVTKFGLVLIFAAFTCSSGYAAPVNWPNAYTAPDGTIWSDVLPGQYSNCISKKDSNGNPILNPKYGTVYCETDSKGDLVGTSANGLTIIDSDAIQACKAMGGELPTIQDFLNLGENYKNLPHQNQVWSYWTTTVSPSENGIFSRGYYGHFEEFGDLERDLRYPPVRCVTNVGSMPNPPLCFQLQGNEPAGAQCQTSVGAIFTKVQGPGGFGLTWKAPNGIIWSSSQGEYENNALQPDQNGLVVKSPATEACANIGGTLPTVQDYKKLLSYFDLDGKQLLTEHGQSDSKALFPDMPYHWFWTSSVGPNPYIDNAFSFNGGNAGAISYVESFRQYQGQVRCEGQ